MKHNAQQLALFGDMSLELADSRGVMVAERYKKSGYKKPGKEWKGKVDAKGYCLDAKGKRIPTWEGEIDSEGYCLLNGARVPSSRAITFVPVKSKDGEDMADLTGLTGAALKMHNVMVRTEAFAKAFAVVSAKASSGNFILPNNGLVQHANGDITFRMKATAERIVQRQLTDEELIAEAVKRGLVTQPK